jgi:hypothetical protein
MKTFFSWNILLAIQMLLSCDVVDSDKVGEDSLILVPEIQISDWPNDYVLIQSAEIKNDNLILNVNYSGGCKTHIFKLIISTAIAKSNPPQTRMFLSHYGNSDFCEAYISEELVFDLTTYKNYLLTHFGTFSSIIFHLESYDLPIVYSF